MSFCSVDEAIEEIRAGRMLILLDDEDRENEGDLVMAAELCTPEAINFISKHGRGLICAPISPERADALGLEPMGSRNNALQGTAFTIAVDSRDGTTTGISASDRALTCRVLADPKTQPHDLVRPGHMFPIRAVPGGVLRRAGHTEAVVDLVRMAGLNPVGVLCEILKEDGTMARAPELFEMAERYGLKVFTIEQLIHHRQQTERLVCKVAMTRLPTEYGQFTVHTYHTDVDSKVYIALVMGDVTTPEPVLVRVHSKCLTGDVFRSQKCDCGRQLDLAFRKVAEAGRGVILYLEQEGRGIGIAAKMQAYELQDQGLDTVEANHKLGYPADLRDYGLGCQVLKDLGLSRIRLMTNNPAKRVGIEGYGLEVVERVPLKVKPHDENLRYLTTKREKMGHLLDDLYAPSEGDETADGNGHHTRNGESVAEPVLTENIG